MKCKCKAKPEPTVTWYRGQDLVEKSKKIKINSNVIAEDTYELTLEIKVRNETHTTWHTYIHMYMYARFNFSNEIINFICYTQKIKFIYKCAFI